MNIQIERPSARIIPFPSQPRIEARFGADATQPPVRVAAVGESWYHEAAIREAEGKTSA